MTLGTRLARLEALVPPTDPSTAARAIIAALPDAVLIYLRDVLRALADGTRDERSTSTLVWVAAVAAYQHTGTVTLGACQEALERCDVAAHGPEERALLAAHE